MEAEARDRFWQEIERIATGILILPDTRFCRALPVSGICDRRNNAIRLYGSADAAADLELGPGVSVCITFADVAECVFVSLQAAISVVDRSVTDPPARLRQAATTCDVGTGIMLEVQPRFAQLWERPGRGFLDALHRLAHGAEETRTLSGPRTITF